MNVPNWQHHSRKEQKRKLKPQALRDARRRRQALLRSLKYTSGPPTAATPRTNAPGHYPTDKYKEPPGTCPGFSITLVS
ncbi:hypothetical protein [Cyanophage S-TIM66]|nr:hypothetical protein [Cyanophage S-TIM66]